MYKYNNPHPKKLRTTDCVVRSIAIAFDSDYLETRRELNRFKRERGLTSYKGNKFLNWYLGKYKEAIHIKVPVVKGESRKRGTDFAKMYPNGTYILSMRKHLATMIDGVIQDTWNSSGQVVYKAWQIK